MPTIHVLNTDLKRSVVDARHKGGHDGELGAAARALTNP